MTLSGGLDSTLSLAMLRTIFPAVPILAYTIGGGEAHPDLHYARIAAARFHITHFVEIPGTVEREDARRMLTAMGDASPSNGAVGVMRIYALMALQGTNAVIAHDGIDELMGGYWAHRSERDDAATRATFENLWKLLVPNHLEPLERKARSVNICVVFPYLQRAVVECISRIPLADRTSREESKKPLCALARKYGVPEEIIARRKRGFCDALDEE